MGIFDTIVHLDGDSGLDIEPGAEFQTKSNEPCLSYFELRSDKRLWLRKRKEFSREWELVPFEFHGDIVLYRSTKDRGWQEFKMRFTNSKLEWTIPLDRPSELAERNL